MFVFAFTLALAAGEPSSGFLICSSQDSSSGRTIVYIGEPVHGSDDDIPEFKRTFVDEVQQRYGIRLPYSGCATAYTRKDAKDAFDYATEHATSHNASFVVVKWSGDRGQDWSSGADQPSRVTQKAKNPSASSSDASTGDAAAGASPHRPKMTNAEADAKFAADKAEYQRKLAAQQDEYKRAQDEVARKKAEQVAAAQQAQAEYQRQLAAHAEALRENQQQAATSTGGRFQATSGFLSSRGAALESLHRLPTAAKGLEDVQCQEVTFYTPPKWTCWGYYREQRKAAAGSAQ